MRNAYADLVSKTDPGGQVGIVYLLHFSVPFQHARHYTGWTAGLEARLELHRAGQSRVPLIKAAVRAGITLELARTWPDATRARERQLKNQGGASRLCPLCGVTPRGSAS